MRRIRSDKQWRGQGWKESSCEVWKKRKGKICEKAKGAPANPYASDWVEYDLIWAHTQKKHASATLWCGQSVWIGCWCADDVPFRVWICRTDPNQFELNWWIKQLNREVNMHAYVHCRLICSRRQPNFVWRQDAARILMPSEGTSSNHSQTKKRLQQNCTF